MKMFVLTRNRIGRTMCHSCLGLFALALSGLAGPARANVEIIAEYRLGASTSQITYTGGPETMVDAAGKNNDLKREGNPRFVASAPSVPSAKGAGALEFDGKNDAYVRTGALFGPTGRFGLEVWVNAAEASVKGLQGVVANGNGARGYVLGQSGNRWVAFIGSVGPVDIGPVTLAAIAYLLPLATNELSRMFGSLRRSTTA